MQIQTVAVFGHFFGNFLFFISPFWQQIPTTRNNDIFVFGIIMQSGKWKKETKTKITILDNFFCRCDSYSNCIICIATYHSEWSIFNYLRVFFTEWNEQLWLTSSDITQLEAENCDFKFEKNTFLETL